MRVVIHLALCMARGLGIGFGSVILAQGWSSGTMESVNPAALWLAVLTTSQIGIELMEQNGLSERKR